MTADSSTPQKPIPAAGDDAATGTDKAMKQFSRTDAERDRVVDGKDDLEADGKPGKPEKPDRSTQPPPSTAPAEPDGKA